MFVNLCKATLLDSIRQASKGSGNIYSTFKLMKYQNYLRKPEANKLYQRSQYYFVNDNNKQEKPQPEQKQDQKTKQSVHDINTQEFFEFIKKSKFVEQQKQKNENVKQYSNHFIYKNKFDENIMKNRVKQNIVYAGLWIGAAVVIYQYIHHWASIIPCWFFAGNMLQYKMGSKYIQKLVSSIELTEPKNVVKIKLSNGQIVTAKIEDIDFIDIIELTDKGPVPLAGRPSSQIKSDSFITVFDVMDVNQRDFKDLRLLVEQKKVEIENLDLLKHILTGETEEVQLYTYVEEPKEKQNKEDEALEKKLEEEIQQIKKQEEEQKQKSEKSEENKKDSQENKKKTKNE